MHVERERGERSEGEKEGEKDRERENVIARF